MSALTQPAPAVEYPDDDGLPMSDNTAQMRWIFLVLGNLEIQFRDRPDVFVAGNHLVYPVEGDGKTRLAPDVFVAFGRPKHDRGSYRVWEVGGVFPQVVFEVWSPSNRYHEMEDKRRFYETYGAEEYYILYPEFPAYVEVWHREGGGFVRAAEFADWVSPRLGIRFGVDRGELYAVGPTGRRFLSPAEMAAEAEVTAERLAEATRRAEQERERAEKLAARLRALGVDPDAG